MKLFDDLFKDLTEMEGKNLSEIMLSSTLDKFHATIISEGEPVYDLFSKEPNFQSCNPSMQYQELLYHMERTEDGKLRPISIISNGISNEDTRNSISNTIFFNKLKFVYEAVQNYGVLKTDDENNPSYLMWANGGLAYAYVDPTSDEKRFFYNKEGKLVKVLGNDYFTTIQYTDDGFRLENTIFFEISDHRSNNGRFLDESYSVESVYDSENRLIKNSRTKIDKKTNCREGYVKTVVYTEDDHYCYSNTVVKVYNHLPTDCNITIENLRLDKETHISQFLNSKKIVFQESNIHSGRYAVIEETSSVENGDDIYDTRTRIIHDDYDIKDIFLSTHPMLQFNDPEIILQDHPIIGTIESTSKVKKYHFPKLNISVTEVDNKVTHILISYSILGVDIMINSILPVVNNNPFNSITNPFNSITVKTTVNCVPLYNIEDIYNMLIDDLNRNIVDQEELKNYLSLFYKEYSSIREAKYEDALLIVNSGAMNYSITLKNDLHHQDLKIIEMTTTDDNNSIETKLVFNDEHNHLLNMDVETADIKMKYSTVISSDITPYDIIKECTKEELQKWEQQLKKLLIEREPSRIGCHSPQKIIPMSRSEKKQS